MLAGRARGGGGELEAAPSARDSPKLQPSKYIIKKSRKMVTFLLLVKNFNVFIWMSLDGAHNHG